MTLNQSSYDTLINRYRKQDWPFAQLPPEKKVILLQQYSTQTSKQFLLALLSEHPEAPNRLQLIANNQDIFFTILLDDIFLEKLTSAGHTLLLLNLVTTIPKTFIQRYLEVCRLVTTNPEEINHICQLIKEYCL